MRGSLGLLLLATLVLLNAPPAVAAAPTLTGTLTTPTTLSDGNIHLMLPSGHSISAPIAEDGSFSVTPLEPGVYQIAASGNYYERDLERGYNFNWGFDNVDLTTTDQYRDLTVPGRPLTVDVVDGNGDPVSTRYIDVGCGWTIGTVHSTLGSISTDSSIGTKSLWAAVNPGTDPEGHGCTVAAGRTENNYAIRPIDISATEDNHITIVIPDLITISGKVTASDSRMKPSSVYLEPKDEPTGIGNVTAPIAEDGTYSVDVPPGEYAIQYRFGDNVDYSVFATLWEGGIDASHSVTVNKHLDVRPLTMHVVAPNGEPAAEPTGSYLSCLRELDLVVNGNRMFEGIVSGDAEGTVDPAFFLPAIDDNDPAWECTVRLQNDNQDDHYYGTANVPLDSSDEVTVVVPSFGLFDGPPGGTGGDDPDGVSNLTEASAPNGGDGNHDGVPDYTQDNVTSLPGNGADPGDNEDFLTIVGPAGSTLTGVSTMASGDIAGSPPEGATLPRGLNAFTLEGITPGSTQTIRLYTPVYGVNAYAKYNPTTQVWSLLPDERVAINHESWDWLEITLTDGGTGDADGTVNGKIVDPGGPAVIPTGDTSAPTVTGRAITRPNGAGWYRSNVRVDWSATDDSGVAQQPRDTVVSTEGANVTATSPQVCDQAPTPNCGRGTLTGLKIDKTAPQLTVTGVSNGATYTLGNVPTAGCTASDPLSGLAGPCKGEEFGGNAAGVGTFTYIAASKDNAGNTTIRKATYRVAYRFDGFLAPLNDPGPPMSVFKAGSTVPVAFTLKRANGSTATPVSHPTWIAPVRGTRTSAPVNEPVSNVKGTSGSRFVLKHGKWTFDWSTKGLSAGYVYRIGVRLDDGTTHYLNIGVR